MKQFFIFFLVGWSSFLLAQVPSPTDFMPHAYGKEFTPHDRLVDYFYAVAGSSPLVEVHEYGKTNQKRPLIYAVITSEKNAARLDAIRENNLIRAGVQEGIVNPTLDRSIVWLSFGVHGNEAGASESSMNALYQLTNEKNNSVAEWLENTIVIVDPCINPDGYNRYTHFNINCHAHHVNPHADDQEHNEPWPSGRVNHFFHDLNRDWAWASQIETQQRLVVYHDWLPHVHADFHEMYPESPYYFAPAAEPYHKYISDFQRNFQITIGKNHAKHFDKNNWLYYTRESFDLFYPSYGDTYPTFNGAIGMTYEQAGHGVAGRAILLNNGDTLKLQDRIDHHTATALSTVEAASKNSTKLVAAFGDYFQKSVQQPTGKYMTFIIRNSQESAINDFCKLLDRHDIRYGQAQQDGSVSGYVYRDFKDGKFNYKKGDLVVSAAQPHGTMAQVLLEPKAFLSDSVTYDITAWSLLHAFGFEAAATQKQISTDQWKTAKLSLPKVADGYAYVTNYSGLKTGKFIAALDAHSIQYRIAGKAFVNSGKSFDRGSIVITHADNKNKDLITDLQKISANIQLPITTLSTGFSDQGPDIGSDEMRLGKTPKILLVGGEGTSQYNYGQIWQMLDQKLGIGYTTTTVARVGNLDLDRYNTIILPSGYYGQLSEGFLPKMKSWVAQGGKLIAFENAIRRVGGEDGFGLELNKPKPADESKKRGDHKLERFESAFRKQVSNWMPGAIVQLTIDDSHPLGYGLGSTYASLKLSTMTMPHQDHTWNVGYIGDELRHTGFVGNNVKSELVNSNTFFVKNIGSGQFIGFVDNPLYRSFWYQGEQLFSNALFMVQ